MGIFSKKIRLPIVGVQGAGKTYFFLCLGYLVSLKGLGEVSGVSHVYFSKLLEYVLRNEPIPATEKDVPIRIEIRIPKSIKGGTKRIVITSRDISGKEFETAMRLYAEDPIHAFNNKSVRKFIDLYRKVDGLLVVIDIVRDKKSYEEFVKDKDKNIRRAFAEQVLPLARVVETAIEHKQVKGKPIFFIFTKSDIHRCSLDELNEYLRRILAMTLVRLRNRGAIIKVHATSAIGWGMDAREEQLRKLGERGFLNVLSDIIGTFVR